MNPETLHKTTRSALSALIKEASTDSALRNLETRIVRHYNNGTISASQLCQLDEMILQRHFVLDLEINH
jgi:hypothetical protein